MPLPVIAGAAAAVASRLAAKKAAQKLAQEAAKKAAKRAGMSLATGVKQPYQLRATASADKTAQIAKNSVKTKPAAKQVGNPPNNTKAWEDYIGSVSRGAPGRGPAGKAKATRVANSKTAKNTVPSAKEPARIPEVPARGTVRINSAKTRSGKVVNLKNAPTSVEKVTGRLAASVPARRPASNPANPPRGTVKINSGSKRPAVLQKRAAALKKK
jgi:hypothetical protein